MNFTHMVGTPSITVMNMKKGKPTEPYDFRIDRPNPLCNPFRTTPPDTAIMLFEHYFESIGEPPIHRLEKKRIAEFLRMIKAHDK